MMDSCKRFPRVKAVLYRHSANADWTQADSKSCGYCTIIEGNGDEDED